MGCKPILESHCRVVAALTVTLGVNGPLEQFFLMSLSRSQSVNVNDA